MSEDRSETASTIAISGCRRVFVTQPAYRQHQQTAKRHDDRHGQESRRIASCPTAEVPNQKRTEETAQIAERCDQSVACSYRVLPEKCVRDGPDRTICSQNSRGRDGK